MGQVLWVQTMGHGPWAMGHGPWAMRHTPYAIRHRPAYRHVYRHVVGPEFRLVYAHVQVTCALIICLRGVRAWSETSSRRSSQRLCTAGAAPACLCLDMCTDMCLDVRLDMPLDMWFAELNEPAVIMQHTCNIHTTHMPAAYIQHTCCNIHATCLQHVRNMFASHTQRAFSTHATEKQHGSRHASTHQ